MPSRLIGHRVEVRLHPTTLKLRYAGQLVEIFPRLRGDKSHRIDYRYVIASLVRKPGAFANYRFREELYPTLTFRRAYDALVAGRGDRADVDYVRILYLAAQTTEGVVEAALARLRWRDCSRLTSASITPPSRRSHDRASPSVRSSESRSRISRATTR